MSRKKTLIMVCLLLAVLVSVVLGLLWHMRHYVLVDSRFYPRGVQQLDLRDQEISVRHYEKLIRRLPECRIQWNVPFQGRYLSCDVKEITVNTLDQKDIRMLEYFEKLERITAENCADYENLLQLRTQRTDLEVEYTVPLGTENHCASAKQVALETVPREEISLLDYLPDLQSVLYGGGNKEEAALLKEYCQERGLEFLISFGDEVLSMDTVEVTAEAVTGEQLELLLLLPELRQIHLLQPEVSAQRLLELKQNNPGLTVTWEQELWGQRFSSSVEEIDLSGAETGSLEELEQAMTYFPNAKVVFLGECGLDNALLAAHRELARDSYKLVWTVSCGSKLKIRTDATTFMPVRENVFYFNDEEAYNLRYCEDMVCIDIGHMSIHSIEFVEYMPNLEYLILAHTQVQYIESISSCKKLKFLELDWSPVRDLTPLTGCTALEDLNLGNTFADFSPVEEMTWLKNLWMIDCSTAARYRMSQVMTDTNVMVTGAATVANGWRELDNYYAMRDLLGMDYMSW